MSTPNTQHYDVIIAGARCAGAAPALLLARQGARVLVLDKSRYGTDTLSTHALADAARGAGADVRFGASVTGLRHDRAGRVTGITGRAGAARLEASAAPGRRDCTSR